MASRTQAFPKILVCQNTTCKQQGSQKVLAAFERCVPDGVAVDVSGCMGQCGNGPMVVVLAKDAGGQTAERIEEAFEKRDSQKDGAEEGDRIKPHKTWYSAVTSADAFAIAAQHFKASPPPVRKQSVQLQKQQNFFWIWLVGLILFFSLCGLFALVLGGPKNYG